MVTTNSATMVNKGLEILEARCLFDIPLEQIEVVVHPQAAVHSMVEFRDGSTMAQVSLPDMHLPIALALAWPRRIPSAVPPYDWSQTQTWTFEPLDVTAFPAVEVAKTAGRLGGTYPAVFNAVNEEAVEAFHRGALGFLDIIETVEQVLGEHTSETGDLSLEKVQEAERWSRHRACEWIRSK